MFSRTRVAIAELLRLIQSTAVWLDDSAGGAVTSSNGGLSPLVSLHKVTYHKAEYDVAIHPEPCGSQPLPGIIVVQCLPEQAVRRKVARQTWVQEARKLGYRVVFFMGVTPALGLDALAAEAAEHRDLLLVGFRESYLNLTLKSIVMVDWVSSHCLSARFLVKVDDDVYLHVDTLHTLLSDRAVNRGGGRQVLGVQAERYKPMRSPSSKWYMPFEVYAGAFYPTFVYGPCYVLSTDLLSEISAQCKSQPYIPYEDVFVTGMCTQQLSNVTRYHRDEFIQTSCGKPGTVAVHWYSCWQGRQVELKQLFTARGSS